MLKYDMSKRELQILELQSFYLLKTTVKYGVSTKSYLCSNILIRMHGIEFNGIGSVWSSKISSRKHCYYYIVSNLILFLSMRHLIPSGSYTFNAAYFQGNRLNQFYFTNANCGFL
ncbi:hypothetical protein T4D_15461 [Trichinella pseudospiralis]|uniref:Uncharacterized protein n=1 Tax=Trichinella pseudospiralis TaxID=6337 RepID=A0A0V1FW80_TRIPS|nr:hypothetical protein T4D_15461 [Trichinella pseudospiralis]